MSADKAESGPLIQSRRLFLFR
ncbi:hypothetical protein DN614_16510 [Klebsiella michiganensis]|nr:hypothetical protein DN614_16510 [Klebsiella michiganensis]